MDKSSSNLLVAIHLGSNKTGCAYSFERYPTKVYTLDFNEGGVQTTIPTSILFSPDKTFHSFGVEAEEKYTKLHDENREMASRWYFFQNFNSKLPEKTLIMNLELRDLTDRKQMPALDVFSAAIGYMKKRSTEELQMRGVQVVDSEITWMLTVPAPWEDTARNFMLEAAQRAGIPGDQLELVLELEAAAVYCLEHFKSGETLSKPGVKFILVDCGKTTVNISAFQVLDGNRLEHMRPQGNSEDVGFTRSLAVRHAYRNSASFDTLDREEPTGCICQSIKEIKGYEKVGSVHVIFLIGELSETDVVQTAVRETFPGDRVLVPPSPSAAVLTGAVMYGHNPDVIAISEKERLNKELQKMTKEKEDLEREVKELKKHIQQMRTEKEHGKTEAKGQIASLTAELEKMKKEKELAEKTAAELDQEKMESAAIQRKAEATITTLQGQLDNTKMAEEEIRRTFLEMTEHCKSLEVQFRKLETKEKQFHKQLRQAQEEAQKIKEKYCQKLEKEMQVSEEFRRQLRTLTEERDFREMVTKSLQRVEDSLNEVAANTGDTYYRSESSLDRVFMNRLPGDVKMKCLQIQSFIGGMGRDFSERLLGRHVTWSKEELEDNNFFFNRSKFWLCIRKWVEASSDPNTDAPLTLDHLTSVCNKLCLDPTSLTEMSRTQVEVLEGNFKFLAESMLVVEVVAYLRNAKKLTEEARSFLLAPGTPRQKVDRLLAVLYSMGEEGYPQLLEALEVTQQPHVVHRLKEEEAAIKRLAQGTQEGEGTEEPRGASVAGHCTTEVRDDDTNASDDVQRDDDQDPDVLHEDRQAVTLQDLQRLLEERAQATVRQVAEVCRVLIHSVDQHISANQSKLEEKLDNVHYRLDEMNDSSV